MANNRDALCNEYVSEVLHLPNAVRHVVILRGFYDPACHGLHVTACHATVGVK